MLTLEELKKDRALINSIDWEMTPELSARVYSDWGNIWARGEDRRDVVRSKNEYSIYFVVNCWDKPYYIYLLKRSIQEAVDIAKFALPESFCKTVCLLRGIYALDGELKEWLKKELGVPL